MMGNSNLLPEGQELLNGLYTVLSYLQSANEKIREYWDLEREYQNNIDHLQYIEHIKHVDKVNVSTATEKSQYGLFVIGITFAIIFALTSLFGGNGSDTFFALVIVGVFFYGKIKKKKKFFIIGAVLIVAMIIMFVVNLMDNIKYYHSIGNDAAIFTVVSVYAVGFVIAAIVSAVLLKKYNSHVDNKNKGIDLQNRDIDEENRGIDEENEKIDLKNRQIAEYNNYVTKKRCDLSLTINKINAEMVETTSSWYPPDYYSIEAVEQFISYLRNHRADTVKEMINTYIESGFRQAHLKNQEEANRLSREMLSEQKTTNKLLRISNTIQMANLIANTVTAFNSKTIVNNTSSMASSLDSIRKTADGMARKFGLNY